MNIQIYTNISFKLACLSSLNNSKINEKKILLKILEKNPNEKIIFIYVENEVLDIFCHDFLVVKHCLKNNFKSCVKVFLTYKEFDISEDYELIDLCVELTKKGDCFAEIMKDKRFIAHDRSNFLIRNAAYYSNWEVVKLLIELGSKEVNPAIEDNYVLNLACFYKEEDVVKLILGDERVDPSHLGNEPLINACKSGSLEICKMLLMDKRVDPSLPKNKPLEVSFINGHLEITSWLLNDPRIDDDQRKIYGNLNSFMNKKKE